MEIRKINAAFDPAVLDIEAELIEWRRHMHKYPEVSFEEYNTTEYIAAKLKGFGDIKIERPTRTGLVARIFGTKQGSPAVLGIRADIDALPMPEENDLPYASTVPNVMHACGHDGHAAILLALAKLLYESRESFCGEARLIFQHAEELPPGGAIELLRAGALDGVDTVIALHLSSNWDTGIFGVKSGVLTAAVDSFDITVHGKGGHCAFPEQCTDPVVTAAQLVMALQTIVSRRIGATQPAIVSVCQIHGGTAYNIIPNDVTLTAAVRSFDPNVREGIQAEVRRIANGVCGSAGASCDVKWNSGYPSVVNDDKLCALADAAIAKRFGSEMIDHIGCIMPGEDYAYFLDGRPGFFVELGTRNAEKSCDMPHHNPRYRMDEDALKYGLQYFVDMTREILSGNK